MTASTTPPALALQGSVAPTSPSVLVGCHVRTARGHTGRVVEIGRRYCRVRMQSGAEKRFAMDRLHKLAVVQDVPREGREGRFLERLSKPRPTECEVCGKELTDLVSIAIGVGPTCRSPMLRRQNVRLDEQRPLLMEKACGDDREVALAAVEEMDNDEGAARFLLWIYELEL